MGNRLGNPRPLKAARRRTPRDSRRRKRKGAGRVTSSSSPRLSSHLRKVSRRVPAQPDNAPRTAAGGSTPAHGKGPRPRKGRPARLGDSTPFQRRRFQRRGSRENSGARASPLIRSGGQRRCRERPTGGLPGVVPTMERENVKARERRDRAVKRRTQANAWKFGAGQSSTEERTEIRTARRAGLEREYVAGQRWARMREAEKERRRQAKRARMRESASRCRDRRGGPWSPTSSSRPARPRGARGRTRSYVAGGSPGRRRRDGAASSSRAGRPERKARLTHP
jgi:hypothetical protein